jgi:hypothetical protein
MQMNKQKMKKVLKILIAVLRLLTNSFEFVYFVDCALNILCTYVCLFWSVTFYFLVLYVTLYFGILLDVLHYLLLIIHEGFDIFCG